MFDNFDSSDERHISIARKIEAERIESDMAGVRKILSSKEGRRFFWRYMADCKVFHTTFTGNNTTFFNEGMRQVGLKMLSELSEAQPDSYVTMQTEEQQRKQMENQKFIKELSNG